MNMLTSMPMNIPISTDTIIRMITLTNTTIIPATRTLTRTSDSSRGEGLLQIFQDVLHILDAD